MNISGIYNLNSLANWGSQVIEYSLSITPPVKIVTTVALAAITTAVIALKINSNEILHYACENNLPRLARLALAAGAHVNAADSEKWTPLHYAADGGSLEIVKLLVGKGALPLNESIKGDTPFDRAFLKSHLEIAQYLLDNGANINFKKESGESIIERAFRCNHVQFLIDNNADLNSYDGYSPLCYALSFNSLETARLFIAHGANINGAFINGLQKTTETVLHYLCRRGDRETVQFLIENGAEINVKNSSGQTPLHVACDNSSLNSGKLLIEALREKDFFPQLINRELGIQKTFQFVSFINEQDQDGNTALHFISRQVKISEDDIELWNFLIENGALMLPNSEGLDPHSVYIQNHGVINPGFFRVF